MRPVDVSAMPHADVRCPHCFARYRMPCELMGPGGARVRCPRCETRFDVTAASLERPAPAPAHVVATSPPASPVHGATADPAPGEADALASEILDRRASDAAHVAQALRTGRLFSEAGVALLEAWDEYRSRAGDHADAAVFRDALFRRWNVALAPRTPSPAADQPPV
jgi:predicted Zn finger-like uncharacterized protein